MTNATKTICCYSYSVFVTLAVCMFQVASNSSDDIPDENSDNLLSSKRDCQLRSKTE